MTGERRRDRATAETVARAMQTRSAFSDKMAFQLMIMSGMPEATARAVLERARHRERADCMEPLAGRADPV